MDASAAPGTETPYDYGAAQTLKPVERLYRRLNKKHYSVFLLLLVLPVVVLDMGVSGIGKGQFVAFSSFPHTPTPQAFQP